MPRNRIPVWMVVMAGVGLELLLLAAHEARAATSSLIATDDAYLVEATPDSVQDTFAIFARLNTSAGASFRHEMTAVRFDISGLSGNVTSATLNLIKGNTNSAQLNLFGVFEANSKIGGVLWDDNWIVNPDANSLTWNNAPFLFPDSTFPESGEYIYDRMDLVPDGNVDSTNLIAHELVGDATAGVTFAGALGAMVSFNTTANFTGFLQQAIDQGDSVVTLVIASRSTALFNMVSTENAEAAMNNSQKPTLVVETAVPGDFNSDGNVDGLDFAVWQMHFPTATDAILSDGDADGDADVDGADFVVWQTNFDGVPESSPVPEPTGIMLACCGFITGLAWRRRCKGQRRFSNRTMPE